MYNRLAIRPGADGNEKSEENKALNLTLELNGDNRRPTYDRLASAFITAIECGRLQPGDALPSTRELSMQLGLSRGTIRKSYETLLNKGLIEGIPGSGTVVSRKRFGQQQATANESLSMSLSTPAPVSTYDSSSLISGGARRILQLDVKSESAPVISPSVFPPAEVLPIKEWEYLLRLYCRKGIARSLECGAELGDDSRLRRTLAKYFSRTKAVRCDQSQVFVFPTSQHALSAIAALLIDRGDVLAFENVSDAAVRHPFTAQGAKLIAIDTDNSGLNTDALNACETWAKLVSVTPACLNPLGCAMSEQRKHELLIWAQKKAALILENACDSDYYYGEAGSPCLQGMAASTPVIYFYSFSKVLHPLTDLVVIIMPPPLVSGFRRLQQFSSTSVSFLESYVLSEFISQGGLDAQIRSTQRLYQKRRQALIFALATSLGADATLLPRTSGLHLTVRFTDKWSKNKLLSCSEASSLPLISTGSYYLGNPHTNEYMIPFSLMAEEQTPTKVAAFSNLLAAEDKLDQAASFVVAHPSIATSSII